METAVWLVVIMILSAPLIGYAWATAWAADKGLVRKERFEDGSVATTTH